MSVRALPDVEGLVVAYLTAHPDIDIDERVSTVLPENPTRPYITVERVGGRARPHPHWLDQAHMEIVVWGEDPANDPLSRDATFDLCATALAAVHELSGVTELGVVCDVEDVLGPRPIPDPATSWPRYIAEVLVTAHPDPNAGS